MWTGATDEDRGDSWCRGDQGCEAHYSRRRHSKFAASFGSPTALVVCVLRVRAERPAASRQGAAGRRHGSRRRALLDPVDDRRQHVESVERDGPPPQCPMPGARNRRLQFMTCVGSAVGFRHALVVVDRVERREPRIADAMIEDQLPAASRERVQVGPRARSRSGSSAGSAAAALRPRRRRPSRCGERRSGRVRAARAAIPGMPCVDAMPVSKRKPGIHLAALRVLRAGERLLDRRRLRLREAAVSLRVRDTRASSDRNGSPRVEHHAVLEPVARVAGVQQSVDDGLAVRVRQARARISGLPDASFGATSFSIVATHSSPMPREVGAHRRRPDNDAVEVGRDSAAPSACLRARRSSTLRSRRGPGACRNTARRSAWRARRRARSPDTQSRGSPAARCMKVASNA